jgi:hypothetical protein
MGRSIGAIGAVALLSGCIAGAAHAAVPQTVACSAEVTACAKALDGVFPALGEQWQTDTAWWIGTAPTLTFDFGEVVSLTGFSVSLDNNDSYRLTSSIDGDVWTPLHEVLYWQGSVGWGMDTFAVGVAPTALRYVRIVAFDGDNFNSVGEFSAQAVVVPEPGTWALMAGGLALLALRRRMR